MQGQRKEQWLLWCEQAAVEQDPERLLELVKRINRLLEEKEERLKSLRRQRDCGGRNGKKRAIFAVARKLAVLLHRLWISGEVYEPLQNSQRSAMATAA